MRWGVGKGLLLAFKNGFNGLLKQPRHFEGQGQRRIELALLNSDDRLAADFEPLCQISLGPILLGPQDLEAILYDRRNRPIIRPAT